MNLVECIGDNLEQLQQQVNQICHRIQSDRSGQATGYYLAQTGEEIASLWELRKRGVGLLGNAKGDRKPIPFIEDTAVLPSHLASYIQEFKTLLGAYQLDYPSCVTFAEVNSEIHTHWEFSILLVQKSQKSELADAARLSAFSPAKMTEAVYGRYRFRYGWKKQKK